MTVTTQASESDVKTDSQLISPYGGELVNLLVPKDKIEQVKEYAGTLPSIQISERAVCDLELLAIGAFSPLDRFMTEADHQSVMDKMRLANGAIFPVPITLPVEPNPEIKTGQDIALRDAKNNLLAVMTVEEMYEWDLSEVAKKVVGSEGPEASPHFGNAPLG